VTGSRTVTDAQKIEMITAFIGSFPPGDVPDLPTFAMTLIDHVMAEEPDHRDLKWTIQNLQWLKKRMPPVAEVLGSRQERRREISQWKTR
jgi:hypothetical protein